MDALRRGSVWLAAAWAALVAAGSLLLMWVRHRAMGRRLPGPVAWPLLGNCLTIGRSETAIASSFVALFASYRAAFRFWIGEILQVVLVDRRDHEAVLSGHEHMRKGLLYNFLLPWLGRGLLTSAGARWRLHRKVLTPAFHFKILDQFAPLFASSSDVLVRKLAAHAGGPPFDALPLVQLLTLDVICETAMGIKINAQLDSTSDYVTAVNDFSVASMRRGLSPWLWLDCLFHLTDIGKRHRAAIKTLHETTEGVIRRRKLELDRMEDGGSPLTPDELGQKRRVAFLDLLLLSARAGAAFSDQDIREEVDTFMFEGHDTTAAALAATLWQLSLHQDVQEKVVAEVAAVCALDASSAAAPEQLQLGPAQLAELRYLEMVLKEVLRLFPPVAMVGRVLDSDLDLPSSGGAVTLPRGSSVMLFLYGLHRDPAVFPDPEKFDPERFRSEKCMGRDPFAYLPFSAGPRNCIGQRFAMMEMKTVLAKIVWKFRILPDPTFEPIHTFRFVISSENGMRIRVEERRK